MIKTILVPVDGSDHASKAVALATDIAEKYGARLVLLHILLAKAPPETLLRMAQTEHIVESEPASVVPNDNVPAGMAGSLRLDHRDDWSSVVAERLGDWILEGAAKDARHKGVHDISQLKRDGDVASEIVRCAAEEDASVIVMGSRGLGDLKGLLLGSVSHKVAQLASCSCITVK